jgi:hypothetical protein
MSYIIWRIIDLGEGGNSHFFEENETQGRQPCDCYNTKLFMESLTYYNTLNWKFRCSHLNLLGEHFLGSAQSEEHCATNWATQQGLDGIYIL